MRVDTAPGGPSQLDRLDALNRLKSSVAALRRRWYLVVVPMLLGAALGWFSTPEAPEVAGVRVPVPTGPTYYRAAHILIDEGQGSSGGTVVNLPQVAYLVNTGEIPRQVAAALDLTEEEVASSMIGLPRSQVSSVEVQAVGTDREQVVEMADAAALALISTLQQQAEADRDRERDDIITRLEQLDGEISALNVQIAADPPNRGQLEAQARSLTNQYSLVYEQFAQLANRPAPTAGLVSLEGAKPVRISKAEFEQTKRTIRDGADYVTGVVTTTVPETSDEAEAPSAGAPAPTRAAVGGIAGLALGAGLVLLLDRFDSRLRRREDVEAATALPVVAEIPPLTRHQQHAKEVIAHAERRSRSAEAYRVVRGALLFDLAGRQRERDRADGAVVVMVTSASPAEGKTTTVANLAAVFAEGGYNVLVINCDFRRPSIHNFLLAGDGAAEAKDLEVARFGSVVVTKTVIDRVRLVDGLGDDDPDANPLDVVALQRKVIQATRGSFDVILLDTAPVLTTNDASELFPETDQVVAVVRAGVTKVDAARRMAEVLTRFQTPVIGVVMNGSTEAQTAQYYYGSYESSTVRSREGQAV